MSRVKLKDVIGKYVLIDSHDEVYEGKLVYYDDEFIYIEIDGEEIAFLAENCEIAVYEEDQADEAKMTKKMVEMRKAGKFVFDVGDTLH